MIQTGNGVPTINTEGQVDSLYVDTETGKIYRCTKVEYTWEPVNEEPCKIDWNN